MLQDFTYHFLCWKVAQSSFADLAVSEPASFVTSHVRHLLM